MLEGYKHKGKIGQDHAVLIFDTIFIYYETDGVVSKFKQILVSK